LKAYKSIGKLFDYGIMGQRLKSGASLAVGLTFSFMHLLLLFQFAYNGFGVCEVLRSKIWVSVANHKHRVRRPVRVSPEGA